MVKTFTVVHKMPHYMLIYYKIFFVQTLNIFKRGGRKKRELIIEKQSPLQVSHYWVNISHPLMIGLDHLIKKRVDIWVYENEKGRRKHFALLDKIRGNWYSMTFFPLEKETWEKLNRFKLWCFIKTRTKVVKLSRSLR